MAELCMRNTEDRQEMGTIYEAIAKTRVRDSLSKGSMDGEKGI